MQRQQHIEGVGVHLATVAMSSEAKRMVLTCVLVCQTPCASNDPTSSIPFLYRYVNTLLALCIL